MSKATQWQDGPGDIEVKASYGLRRDDGEEEEQGGCVEGTVVQGRDYWHGRAALWEACWARDVR